MDIYGYDDLYFEATTSPVVSMRFQFTQSTSDSFGVLSLFYFFAGKSQSLFVVVIHGWTSVILESQKISSR